MGVLFGVKKLENKRRTINRFSLKTDLLTPHEHVGDTWGKTVDRLPELTCTVPHQPPGAQLRGATVLLIEVLLQAYCNYVTVMWLPIHVLL